ncbi:uncharacterized protein [Apostichopus japonicus]|uniref:uncharacterized protein n=1 Tax=Stichopus japonicus TaxID=307972 RepID=UPI003AB280E4
MSTIDQKEYLKRYLSVGDSKPKKKRKKKQPVVKRTMVIVDDDVDIKSLAPSEETVEKVEEELYDDAPTVAGVVDERPEEDQRIEEYRQSNKWKMLKDKRDEEQNNSSGSQQTSLKKTRHDSDSDHSPLRSKNTNGSNEDLSPLRSRNRHDSDVDLSPARNKNKRHDSDSDLSPQRSKNRQDSDGDLSPLRTRKRHDSDSDLSPRRSKVRHDSDSDLSPRRSKKQDMSGSDLSPERSVRKSRQSNNERKGQRKRGDRRREESDSDLSPTRNVLDKSGKMKKTLSGHKAGLQDAKTLKKENEANRRRQDRLFEAMGDEDLGKNSATIFRDKAGKKRDLAKEKEEAKEAAAKKAKENEQFLEWGKGMAQKERQDQSVEDAVKEMAKPLARYENDRDLDAFLKEQERDGDPMLAMLRKKKTKERELAGIKEKPKYRGPAPQPNRFKIPPGYRWDGVNRSNGFEKKYFARTANNKAMQEVKYKWSVEDM